MTPEEENEIVDIDPASDYESEDNDRKRNSQQR